MVFKRRKRPEISKPTNFQHIRKTYFDINSQTLKDLPPQWSSILTDEDISRTAVAAYERHKQREQQQHLTQQSRPKPLIGDPCFLTQADLEFLKVCLNSFFSRKIIFVYFQSQTIVRGSPLTQQQQPQVFTNQRQTSPPKTPDDLTYSSQNQPIQIQRNIHLDRLYNVKSPDPIVEPRKPSVPNYQNDFIIPTTNGKVKQTTSPVVVTPREKIDGSTKLSLEDVRIQTNRISSILFLSNSSFLPYKKLLVNLILVQCTIIL